jgi:hypothetical protein
VSTTHHPHTDDPRLQDPRLADPRYQDPNVRPPAYADPVVLPDRETVMADEVVDRPDGPATLARIIGLVTGAAVTILGIVALAKVDWQNAEIDRPLVAIQSMTFSPVVAGVTVAIGLVLILLAAARDGGTQVAFGAILAVLGVAILFADELHRSWSVTDRNGWLALGIGAITLLCGFLAHGRRAVVRRRAETYARVR